MFRTVLVANRGEIAARIIGTLKRLGVEAIGVASDSDRFTPPMRAADRVMRLGGGAVAQTYLNADAIVAAARASGAEAIHPGYGFLSENAAFAERLKAEGIVFIGPRPEHISEFGTKHGARAIAKQCGVPLLPGSGLLNGVEHALAEAARISYPVMLKSTAGGGGIGMQLCRNAGELSDRFVKIARLAANNFGDARLFLERFVARARHIEVQIFGDGKGGVVALGERDCSVQRRNQKVVEETPAPDLGDTARTRLREAAIALGRAVKYESAGTVEFLYDVDRREPYFLEVNTRLQVEHPVTEEVFGIDLVEWMIHQAAGEFTLPEQNALRSRGHAIEVRLYAEDPARNFRPSTGVITGLSFPKETRIESWIEQGSDITSLYDPLLAKIVVKGGDRKDALARLRTALDATAVSGIETNLAYLSTIAAAPFFQSGTATTASLSSLVYEPARVEVVEPGTHSSLQDWPGRIGYWDVGVPPSGPMDDRSHRLVNRIVGNAQGAATLECTLSGPVLRFLSPAEIALGGAVMEASLDGAPVPYWRNISVKAGQVLALGRIGGPGLRTYLAVRGGFDAPLYLGSKATFALGGFGGHATGTIKAGDMLRIGNESGIAPSLPADSELPALTNSWEIGVLYGPHGAPDYLTESDIKTLFGVEYEVHFNSARTGIRLIGPKPQWARADGGEAGLHPSNIHDNAYAVGAIDFTGDMPIILGPDGPSLGGFVSPAAVAQGELWKLGQLKPGDKIRLRAVSIDEAARLKKNAHVVFSRAMPQGDALMRFEDRDGIVYRRAGDDNILVEYGPMVLNLSLRLRAHGLMQAIGENRLPGILDLTPGIRSLQVHYDNEIVSEDRLLSALVSLERNLPDPETVSVESRIVHLPLSWNDPQAQLAMRKYQELVRPNAPWCPSNIEFIRRINGLSSEDDVRRIVFAADYLVLGLGNVYLGAPVATPLDPRHRLVTTKYNPARTWTPENAVGIGGAYLCIYGMEGPGGYQLFGRTVQMWNRWHTTECFEKPWLLRFFDRIRFFPVSSEELLEAREAFPHGRYPLKIEPGRFSLAEHRRYLDANGKEIATFKTSQQRAFEAERLRWKEFGLDSYVVDADVPAEAGDDIVPDGMRAIYAPVTGTVWKIEAELGQHVSAGQAVVVIETMKMETIIPASHAGIVREQRCQPGRVVKAGQIIAVIGDFEMILGPFDIARLREAYRARTLSPIDVAKEALRRIAAYPDPAVWIARVSEDTVMARAHALAKVDPESLPLYGIPFAVKDNIDCAGMPTTAACPAFAYTPAKDAHVVERLLAAGAILLGKTNLDQFATGLVGTRSPYGAPRSVFDSRYISGGSSSGSAVAVAAGLVAFALGTDTAGSGRVPAAYNNIVGVKPTRSILSARGVVPACRSLDCVSIFTLTAGDGLEVLRAAAGFDASDDYSRHEMPVPLPQEKPRFGVLAPGEREFFGDTKNARAYERAIERMETLGGTKVEIDFAPFRRAGALLYEGAWVAERLAALKTFAAEHADAMDISVRAIVAGAARLSAVDAFEGHYALAAAARAAEAEWARMDVLLLPTAPTQYTVDEVNADPIALNRRLGHYTNFVNLLDCCAVAVPAGFRGDGLPFGVTLIAPAFSDASLAVIADRLHRAAECGMGAARAEPLPAQSLLATTAAQNWIEVFVVGAHLSGMMLNHELTSLGAVLRREAATALDYRLYVLPDAMPPKPGLVRTPGFRGPGIPGEVWAVPATRFGAFVALIPAPLGMGKVTLRDGAAVSGFLCEAHALERADDITDRGGWRRYVATNKSLAP